MNTLKRVLAILALIAAAVFLVMMVYLLIVGQIQERFSLVLIPMCVFLGLGVLTLAINWLQNLKKQAQEEKASSEK